jgi:UDP:flavonoid glycosyltransferase YjiC (YdhE family)
MPLADVVVCHGGHGTLVRALAAGAIPVICPAAGDMNENAARVAWAGVGMRLPRRWARPGAVRLAVERVLSDPSIRARVHALATWAATHDSGADAACALEGLPARRSG